MKILSLTTLILFAYLQIPLIYAMGLDEVALQEISTTKKTVVIDRGLLENYYEKSFGKFFIQMGDYKFPKIYLVAEGKLVKSFPKKSIWYLTKIYDPRFFKVNARMLIMTSDQVKVGRTMKVKQRHVLLSSEEYESPEQYLEENKNNVPDRLLQNVSAYDESEELYESKKTPDADLEIETYEHLKKKGGIQISDQYKDEIGEKYFI